MESNDQHSVEDSIPGERLKGESDKAFKAFCVYRDMDAHERSVLAVYRLVTSRPQTRNAPGQYIDWCTKYRWPERADEWDEYLDSQKRAARVKAARAMEERHVQLSERLVGIAIAETTKLFNRIAKDLKSTDENEQLRTRVPVKELARLADLAVKLERLAKGEPSEHMKIDAEVGMTYTQMIADAMKAKR